MISMQPMPKDYNFTEIEAEMASQMGRNGHLPLRLERQDTRALQHRHSAALPIRRTPHGQRP